MFRKFRKSLLGGALVASAALILAACSSAAPGTSTDAASTGSAKDLKVGWSTIYLTPSWMQQTSKLLDDAVASFTEDGVIESYQVFNANGDTSQQISQIQSMIQQQYDVILVDAGSSTALNPAIQQATNAGITVVSFDSLVTEESIIKVGTDRKAWGTMMAEWLAEELGGAGNIVAFNGPAGVAVSEDAWEGADEVLQNYPDINVVTTLNSEYNVAPAEQAFAAAYAANEDIDGVLALGGAQAYGALSTIVKQDGKRIPITGENYNGFLKMWNDNLDQGFSSLSTAQPNYLGVLALYAAIAERDGQTLDRNIVVPLPEITNDNLSEWVAVDEADDYYPIKNIDEAEINSILGLS